MVKHKVHSRVTHSVHAFLNDWSSLEMLSDWLTYLRRAPKAWVFSNVIAGSDSVGTVMQTIMCMVCCDKITHSIYAPTIQSSLLRKNWRAIP
jgi:hypothetical protein